jgi:hypothetical protein
VAPALANYRDSSLSLTFRPGFQSARSSTTTPTSTGRQFFVKSSYLFRF